MRARFAGGARACGCFSWLFCQCRPQGFVFDIAFCVMSRIADTYVAGTKTDRDWLAFRPGLLAGADTSTWETAFEEYFRPRLALRYLDPIQLLQDNGRCEGEGFSIAAIQCTLIEFLESARQGLKYRYLGNGKKLGPNEYSFSKKIFVAFLCDRQPFSKVFDKASAADFYAGVRCGLLHEAQTRNGWKIRASASDSILADVQKRIVYRDDFQSALLSYIESYKDDLLLDAGLQSAFVRKFDDLCGVQP